MKPIESVVKSESSLLYRSGKLFRLKGGEVELVKGIEPSAHSKLQWRSSCDSANPTARPFSQ